MVKESRIPASLGDPAEHGADDGTEHGCAERGPDHLAAAVARRRGRDPGKGTRPGRGARDALDEPGGAEGRRAVRGGEGEAGHREEDEPSDDGALRAEPRRREPARDAAEQRACPERSDEESGAGLREVELLRIERHERRQRGEEQRVDEDDRADEGEETAHAREDTRLPDRHCPQRNAPSRLRPRPTFRLTTAEATTTRRAINLGHSVLGASGTLGTRP